MERRCEELVDSAVLNQIYENKGRRFEYAIELLTGGVDLDVAVQAQILHGNGHAGFRKFQLICNVNGAHRALALL